jgi:hypothetical protein
MELISVDSILVRLFIFFIFRIFILIFLNLLKIHLYSGIVYELLFDKILNICRKINILCVIDIIKSDLISRIVL